MPCMSSCTARVETPFFCTAVGRWSMVGEGCGGYGGCLDGGNLFDIMWGVKFLLFSIKWRAFFLSFLAAFIASCFKFYRGVHSMKLYLFGY